MNKIYLYERDTWRVVISNKPNRRGEAFIMYNETFVLKVYKDSVQEVETFANKICQILQDNGVTL